MFLWSSSMAASLACLLPSQGRTPKKLGGSGDWRSPEAEWRFKRPRQTNCKRKTIEVELKGVDMPDSYPLTGKTR